jgi:hypothetical protein
MSLKSSMLDFHADHLTCICHSQIEIEQALITFSREQHGGLIAMPHTVTVVPLQKSGCLC